MSHAILQYINYLWVVIKNKKFILPFLFLAWTIIFAHSIIPHHHHSEDIISVCTQCNLHDAHFFGDEEIQDCDLDCNNFTCHFQVKILTQVSIDNVFIITAENSLDNYLCYIESKTHEYYTYFIPDQIHKTKFLRGPPIIS